MGMIISIFFVEKPPKKRRDPRLKGTIVRRKVKGPLTLDDIIDEGPDPFPQIRLKQDIFLNENFEHVEKHVAECTEDILTGTYDELVNFLTGNTKWGIVEKVRAIFLWVTSHDIYNLKVKAAPPKNSPLEYLVKIKSQQGTHAHLFYALCQLARVPCVIINGMTKNSMYRVGKKVDRKKMSSQWNAVYMKDHWWFVDTLWGSSHVVSKKDDWNADDRNVTEVHKLNEFFFLPEADKLVYTHFPDKSEWQLLKNPVSLTEFDECVYVREMFHLLGMKITPESEGNVTLFTEDGTIKLFFSLIFQDYSEHYQFKYLLKKKQTSGYAVDQSLKMNVFYEQSFDMVNYKLRLPKEGTFRMEIYGLDLRIKDSFRLTCCYLINCTKDNKTLLHFPDNPQIGWGPFKPLKDAGYVPVSHPFSTTYTSDGVVQIVVARTQGVEMFHTLKHAVMEDTNLFCYALLEKQPKEIIVTLRLPEPGEYGLELFSQRKDEKEKATNVCNYFIVFDGITVQHNLFPNINNQTIGIHHMGEELGVEPVSHPEGMIESRTGKEVLTFKAPEDTDLVCELQTNDDEAEKTMSVKKTYKHGEWAFEVDLPDSGEYALNIYARKKTDPQVLDCVQAYLIMSGDKESTVKKEHQNTPMSGLVETIDTSEKTVIVEFPEDVTRPAVEMRRKGSIVPAEEVKIITKGNRHFAEMSVEDCDGYVLTLFDQTTDDTVKSKAIYQVNIRSPDEKFESNYVPPNMDERIDDIEPSDDEEIMAKRREAREMMKKGINLGIESLLEKGIALFEETNPQKEDRVVVRAKEELEMLKVKKELICAIQERKIEPLERAIKKAHKVNKKNKLTPMINMAQKLVDHLSKLEKLKLLILSMDQKTISELRSYQKPPKEVFTVMSATFILLGQKPKDVQKWSFLVVLMTKLGKESLMRKVKTFEPVATPVNAAKAAKKQLGDLTLTHVTLVSAGAATFHQWTTNMIDEVEEVHGVKQERREQLSKFRRMVHQVKLLNWFKQHQL